MEIVSSILTKNPCYTAGRKITVKGLMLHSVGCSQPRASVFVNRWNSDKFNSACVHAFIDGNDGKVYQTLPWDHRGWHAGAGANNTHIGVEMCEPASIKYTSTFGFTVTDEKDAVAVAKRTYASAVDLFAVLCKTYKLDPLADGVIISHTEGHRRGIASDHSDPEHLWKGLKLAYTMDGFRNDVNKKLKSINSTLAKAAEKESSPKPKKESVSSKPKLKSTLTVAKEVIDGKWGNGTERKKRLTEAGYDYRTVQDKVNELVKSKKTK